MPVEDDVLNLTQCNDTDSALLGNNEILCCPRLGDIVDMSELSQPWCTSMILHGDYFNAISINRVVLRKRTDAKFVHI